MTRRRRIARFVATLVIVLVAGCAQGESSDGRHGRPGTDTADHAHAWATPVPDWPFSLRVDGTDAVVTAGKGRVVALDTARGRERWHAEVADATFYEPALHADTVLLSAADRFIALDRSSGALRWEAPAGDDAGGVALTRAGSDPIALVTTESGTVAALDGATGQTRWSQRLAGTIAALPAVDADAGVGAVLWSHDDTRLRVFDLASGTVRWESPAQPGSSAPVVHGGVIVLGEGTGHFEARVVARDLTSGAERWSVPVPASFESSLTPGADGGDVVVSDHFGTVTLVDARAGKARWQTALREPILRTRVLLTRRSVVLATHRGNVVVLDRGSGRVVRRSDPGGFPVGLGTSGERVIVALRLARPDRVEAWALP
jgi:outer membrane protein assembly factor BamB